MFNPRPVTSPKTKPRCRGAFCFAAVLPSPLWDHKGGGSRPACRTRGSRNAWPRAPSRLGAEPHSPVLFTCQTALLNAPPHTAAAKVSSFVLEARECRTLGVFPPPPAAELGFTRVRPLINWPKSDKSDFGWRVREGAGTGRSARQSAFPTSRNDGSRAAAAGRHSSLRIQVWLENTPRMS